MPIFAERPLVLAASLALALLVGCSATAQSGSASTEGTGGASTATTGGVGGFDPGAGGAGGGAGGHGEFEGCHNVDVLFVIDDSGSMGDKQDALAQAFPGFVNTMKSKLAQAVSYHVGVVTSDDYFANIAGCQSIGDLIVQTGGPESSNAVCGPFAGGRHYLQGTNPALSASFQCIAKVGAGGNDDERVMRGLLNALDPARNAPGACNDGFARPDSLLIIVLIADEDDAPDLGCDPATPPCATGSGGTSTDWYNELVGYRGGIADNVVVLSLINKSQACAGSIGARETGFTLKFKHGVVGDVCSLDYAKFFEDSLPIIGSACDSFTPPK